MMFNLIRVVMILISALAMFGNVVLVVKFNIAPDAPVFWYAAMPIGMTCGGVVGALLYPWRLTWE